MNRQGADIGTQYRSAIFYCDENQEKIAINSMKNIKQSISNIVTELSEAKTFYDAEEYHQNYITKCKVF